MKSPCGAIEGLYLRIALLIQQKDVVFSSIRHEVQDIQNLGFTSETVIFISYFKSVFRSAFVM